MINKFRKNLFVFLSKTSLRFKTFLFFSLICFFSIILSHQFTSKILLNDVLKLEKEESLKSLAQVEEQIFSEPKILSIKSFDWSNWDESYNFVQNKNPTFEKKNLDTSITNLQLDILSFWNDKKELVWGKNIDLLTSDKSKVLQPLSDHDLAIIKNLDTFFTFKNPKEFKFTFLMLKESPYLFIATPITATSFESSIVGSLISGIKIDNKYFANLEKILNLKIEFFYLQNKNHINQENQNFKDFNKNSYHKKMEILNNYELNTYSLIKDHKLKNLILIKLKIKRIFYLKFLKSLEIFLFFNFMFNLVLLLIIVFYIDQNVISKILKINKVISLASKSGKLTDMVPDLGNDEIGKLGTNYNLMAIEIEKLRETTFQQEKLAALGEVASGIGHEINNPIAIIQGASKIIKSNITEGRSSLEENSKHLDLIENTVIRISKIILGLKNISRDTVLEKQDKYTFKEVIEDCLILYEQKFKSAGIKLILNLNDPLFNEKFNFMKVQMTQVFLNLITNAYYAIKNSENPWIEISANFIDKDTLCFYFKDSGFGISQEIQNKIFQPFFTTKKVGEGTGLGLSISSSIIKAHKGILTIDSNSPNTCFVIKFERGSIF
jgi:signal transduction histidine kinase